MNVGDTTPNRLYRSRQNKMIAGVAGGLGQYFNVDPTLFRLAFVVALLIPGIGGISLLAYIILAIVVPQRPLGEEEVEVQGTAIDARRGREIAGGVLIVLGLLALSSSLGLYSMFDWLSWRYVLPIILIGLGALLLLRQRD